MHEKRHFLSYRMGRRDAQKHVYMCVLRHSGELHYVLQGHWPMFFNLCIEQNVFPSEVHKAEVIPLPRTGDHKNLNDYRPISLLSVLSKLLERHVHKHLITYLKTRDIFHPLQSSAFRGKHSCNTTLARLTDSWLSAINRSDLSRDVSLNI